MICYAHSKRNAPRDQWQYLDDHLRGAADRARRFAELFGSGDWAHNAGWLHDLGKGESGFQGYLLRCNDLDDSGYDSRRGNHSTAGALYAEEYYGLSGRILAYLVAGHHAGLPDWYPSDSGNAALEIRLKEERKNLVRISALAGILAGKLREPLARPAFVTPDNFHFWVRMLFSCVVDGDFLDTEQFMEGEKAKERKSYPELGDLAPSFFKAYDELEGKAERSPVNAIRSEIRRACELTAARPRGLFSLTVPTGGGKTLSAMAFAMRHALKHGQRRIIYVIPYTTIIEQTGQVLAGIFGRENVVEHHSNLDPDKETVRSMLAAENWDAPIVVTTNVQFFESLYAAQPSRCRKLHNIVNSVIILDEAQLLPPALLAPCVAGMNDLVKNYSVSIVLATATQPALPGLDKVTEIIPDGMELYRRLKRTDVSFPEQLERRVDWPSLARQLQEHDQVLCVVNSRRDCYQLFQHMPKGTLHLSALMCGAHRSSVIRLIRQKIDSRRPVRVISTQLVEAGVDIDFPVVYRAFAGLDSIAQAAGRCNREGTLNKTGRLGRVVVFIPPAPSPRGLLRKGEDTTRELKAGRIDLDRPDDFTRYFRLFYSRVNDQGEEFLRSLKKDVDPGLQVQFRTAAGQFALIDDQAQQPVIVRYRGSESWLDRLRRFGPTRGTSRALQRFTVNIPRRTAERMHSAGQIEELFPGIMVQTVPGAYDRQTGLAVYADELAVEDLIA